MASKVAQLPTINGPLSNGNGHHHPFHQNGEFHTHSHATQTTNCRQRTSSPITINRSTTAALRASANTNGTKIGSPSSSPLTTTSSYLNTLAAAASDMVSASPTNHLGKNFMARSRSPSPAASHQVRTKENGTHVPSPLSMSPSNGKISTLSSSSSSTPLQDISSKSNQETTQNSNSLINNLLSQINGNNNDTTTTSTTQNPPASQNGHYAHHASFSFESSPSTKRRNLRKIIAMIGSENPEDEDDDDDEEVGFQKGLLVKSKSIPVYRNPRDGASLTYNAAKSSSPSGSNLIKTEEQKEKSRRKSVKFADALGLELIHVKIFVKDDFFEPPQSAFRHLSIKDQDEIKSNSCNSLFTRGSSTANFSSHATNHRSTAAENSILTPEFVQPGSMLDFRDKVLTQKKVGLESCFVSQAAGNLSLQCDILVANVAYDKAVTIRYTTNNWLTYTDYLASYVPGSSNGGTDRFKAHFSVAGGARNLAPGQRLSFAIKYTTGGVEYWDNNDGRNYTLLCRKSDSNNRSR